MQHFIQRGGGALKNLKNMPNAFSVSYRGKQKQGKFNAPFHQGQKVQPSGFKIFKKCQRHSHSPCPHCRRNCKSFRLYLNVNQGLLKCYKNLQCTQLSLCMNETIIISCPTERAKLFVCLAHFANSPSCTGILVLRGLSPVDGDLLSCCSL